MPRSPAIQKNIQRFKLLPLFLLHTSLLVHHPVVPARLDLFSPLPSFFPSPLSSSFALSKGRTLQATVKVMKPVLLLSVVGALAAFQPLACSAARPPLVQDHKNHHYYAVKLNDLSAISPAEIARHLGVEYVGQVGELVNYHLFSYPKTVHEKRDDSATSSAFNATMTADGQYRDIVLKRYEELRQSKTFNQQLKRRSLSKRGVEPQLSEDMDVLGPIQKQILKRRIKRVLPSVRRDEYIRGEEQPADDVAAHFNIADPGFVYQWHLVSDNISFIYPFCFFCGRGG